MPAICHHVLVVSRPIQQPAIARGSVRCLAPLLAFAGYLCLGPCAAARAQTADRDDYMSPQARASVEALKASSALRRTGGSNLAERTPVLWRWINDYALAGGPVPDRATGILQSAFRELLDAKRAGREPMVSLCSATGRARLLRRCADRSGDRRAPLQGRAARSPGPVRTRLARSLCSRYVDHRGADLYRRRTCLGARRQGCGRAKLAVGSRRPAERRSGRWLRHDQGLPGRTSGS